MDLMVFRTCKVLKNAAFDCRQRQNVQLWHVGQLCHFKGVNLYVARV